MEKIFLYNSLTNRKELFVPAYPGQVKIYVCGLTPQDYTHLGHAKLFVSFDVIRRIFEKAGYNVTYIINFTDIDDKIIEKSNKSGENPTFLAEKYINNCLDDLKLLNVKPATYYPRATAHIIDIIEMIEKLEKNGYAYASDGDVFFRVKNFADYGKLSCQSLESLRHGVRVEVEEAKEDPIDFALWKKAKPGELSWKSPWGYGRPGWHIECSAMSIKYLGMGFDIHGGGYDLLFPHHENEIAQSEAYSGHSPFARNFLHVGLLNLKGSKMSKSIGNFLTLKEIFEVYDPMVVRLSLLKCHYRSSLDFYPELLEESLEALIKLKEGFYALDLKLRNSKEEKSLEDEKVYQIAENFKQQFNNSLYDDFNYAASLGYLFSFISELYKIKKGSKNLFKDLQNLLYDSFDVLGLKIVDDSGHDSLLEIISSWRDELRKAGEYHRADLLRDKLESKGYIVQDSPDGTRVFKNPKRNFIR